MNKLIAIILIYGMLAACAGQHKEPPTVIQQSLEANAAGLSEHESGDNEGALAEYEKALRLSRSVEDADGTASNLINMAVILRSMGKPQRALVRLEEILKNDLISYPQARVAEAAYLKGKLYMESPERKGDAEQWIDHAIRECTASQCKDMGRIWNLRAKLKNIQKKYDVAIDSAQKGLEYNRQNNDEIELANSVRLLGEAYLAQGKYQEALERFGVAFDMDQRQAHSGKMARDLMGMGYCHEGLKQPDKALTHFRRVTVIAAYSSDDKTINEAFSSINRLLGKQ